MDLHEGVLHGTTPSLGAMKLPPPQHLSLARALKTLTIAEVKPLLCEHLGFAQLQLLLLPPRGKVHTIMKKVRGRKLAPHQLKLAGRG